ncbi:MAG: response regulator [Nitrospirota bacterium]
MKGMQEKRVFKRAPYTGEILINGSARFNGIDISEGGLYVHTGRNFMVGDVVKVAFPISGRDLELAAEVVVSEESMGMGLQFLDLFYDERQAIIDYISEQEDGKRTNILIVDDNEANRRMNKSKLILEGFKVVEAADGREAVQKLEENIPDLMVLDLHMPVVDGFKVLSYMKGHDKYKKIPVLILSARGDKATIEKAMDLGASSFLVKMITSPAKLVEAVKRLLARRKRSA